MKYAFIEGHRHLHGVQTMCRVLGVTRSGYYAWLHHPVSDRAREDQRLLAAIAIPGLLAEAYTGALESTGTFVKPGKHWVGTVWRASCGSTKFGAVRGYKRPRQVAGSASVVALNRLQRQFTTAVPDKAWVTDIAYIRTWQGWLYLAVVIDLCSRRVVGWSMEPTLSRELVLDALLMAVWRRKPRSEVLVHSEQGSQYGSEDWRRFCREHNLLPSMSRKGNCWDNAVAESFFSSLKKERIRMRVYRTRSDAKADLVDYIEAFYNRKRRHRHLGDVSPAAFESALGNPG